MLYGDFRLPRTISKQGAQTTSLVGGLDVGIARELQSRCEILVKELAELRHAHELRLDADPLQVFLHRRSLQSLFSQAVEAINDLLRRPRRRRQSDPKGGLRVWIAGFRQRRH